MAERRMFAKSIVLSDVFLELPMSARCLYFTLGMLADDDCFVENPRSIMRQCGATEMDMKLLIASMFVLSFESGVIVIKHWRINNYLRSDRYTATKFLEEKALLAEDETGAYQAEVGIPGGIPGGIPEEKVSPQFLPLPPEERENREERTKEEIKEKDIPLTSSFSPLPKETPPVKRARSVFIKPTLEEVEEYCRSRNNGVDAQNFLDFYEMKGWMVGKNHMKDWKAAVRTWERRDSYGGSKRIPGDRTTGTKAVFDLPEVF